MYGVLDFVFGIGFTGLIAMCLQLNPRHIIIRVLSFLKPLGDCSYTLYLIHVPIFVFTSGWLIHTNGLLPKNQYYVIVGTILVTILAYLLHFIIEIPFTKSKKKAVYTEGVLIRNYELGIRNNEEAIKNEESEIRKGNISVEN